MKCLKFCMKNTAFFAASLISSSVFGSAVYSDKQGNGGETHYSRQFLFAAKKLQAQIGDRYDLNSILLSKKVPFSIRPASDAIRSIEGTEVDARSYDSMTSDYPRRKIRVTEIQANRWDEKVTGNDCKGLFYITLHELLVHKKVEASTDYRVTDPTIDRLESEGKIGCDGMPESTEQTPKKYPDIYYKIKTGDFDSLSASLCGLHIEKDDGYLVATYIRNSLFQGKCSTQGKTLTMGYAMDGGVTEFYGQDGNLAIKLHVVDDGNFTYQVYNFRKNEWSEDFKFVGR